MSKSVGMPGVTLAFSSINCNSLASLIAKILNPFNKNNVQSRRETIAFTFIQSFDFDAKDCSLNIPFFKNRWLKKIYTTKEAMANTKINTSGLASADNKNKVSKKPNK